jgi:excisionase family DNA binding protein
MRRFAFDLHGTVQPQERNMPNQDQEDARHPELLTVQEVAEHLRVSRVTVWRWCQKGTLPAFRIGRNWRIPRDRLLELQKCSGVEDGDLPDGKPSGEE